MAKRTTPYQGFNFQVSFDGGETFAGFAEVTGIGSETNAADYRTGNETKDPARRVAGLRKSARVTLKRGLINGKSLWNWIEQARVAAPTAKRTVTIALLDEARKPVKSWVIRGAMPLKYTGPTLNAKGNDVAIEEIVLSSEAIENSA